LKEQWGRPERITSQTLPREVGGVPGEAGGGGPAKSGEYPAKPGEGGRHPGGVPGMSSGSSTAAVAVAANAVDGEHFRLPQAGPHRSPASCRSKSLDSGATTARVT